MSIWAVAGVKCTCVSDFWEVRGIEGPRNGEVLTITEVYMNPASLVTLRFEGYPGWFDEDMGVRHGYNVRCFRPIVSMETDVSMFSHNLNRENA